MMDTDLVPESTSPTSAPMDANGYPFRRPTPEDSSFMNTNAGISESKNGPKLAEANCEIGGGGGGGGGGDGTKAGVEGSTELGALEPGEVQEDGDVNFKEWSKELSDAIGLGPDPAAGQANAPAETVAFVDEVMGELEPVVDPWALPVEDEGIAQGPGDAKLQGASAAGADQMGAGIAPLPPALGNKLMDVVMDGESAVVDSLTRSPPVSGNHLLASVQSATEDLRASKPTHSSTSSPFAELQVPTEPDALATMKSAEAQHDRATSKASPAASSKPGAILSFADCDPLPDSVSSPAGSAWAANFIHSAIFDSEPAQTLLSDAKVEVGADTEEPSEPGEVNKRPSPAALSIPVESRASSESHASGRSSRDPRLNRAASLQLLRAASVDHGFARDARQLDTPLPESISVNNSNPAVHLAEDEAPPSPFLQGWNSVVKGQQDYPYPIPSDLVSNLKNPVGIATGVVKHNPKPPLRIAISETGNKTEATGPASEKGNGEEDMPPPPPPTSATFAPPKVSVDAQKASGLFVPRKMVPSKRTGPTTPSAQPAAKRIAEGPSHISPDKDRRLPSPSAERRLPLSVPDFVSSPVPTHTELPTFANTNMEDAFILPTADNDTPAGRLETGTLAEVRASKAPGHSRTTSLMGTSTDLLDKNATAKTSGENDAFDPNDASFIDALARVSLLRPELTKAQAVVERLDSLQKNIRKISSSGPHAADIKEAYDKQLKVAKAKVDGCRAEIKRSMMHIGDKPKKAILDSLTMHEALLPVWKKSGKDGWNPSPIARPLDTPRAERTRRMSNAESDPFFHATTPRSRTTTQNDTDPAGPTRTVPPSTSAAAPQLDRSWGFQNNGSSQTRTNGFGAGSSRPSVTSPTFGMNTSMPPPPSPRTVPPRSATGDSGGWGAPSMAHSRSDAWGESSTQPNNRGAQPDPARAFAARPSAPKSFARKNSDDDGRRGSGGWGEPEVPAGESDRGDSDVKPSQALERSDSGAGVWGQEEPASTSSVVTGGWGEETGDAEPAKEPEPAMGGWGVLSKSQPSAEVGASGDGNGDWGRGSTSGRGGGSDWGRGGTENSGGGGGNFRGGFGGRGRGGRDFGGDRPRDSGYGRPQGGFDRPRDSDPSRSHGEPDRSRDSGWSNRGNGRGRGGGSFRGHDRGHGSGGSWGGQRSPGERNRSSSTAGGSAHRDGRDRGEDSVPTGPRASTSGGWGGGGGASSQVDEPASASNDNPDGYVGW